MRRYRASWNPEAQMMIVVGALISLPTWHPDHPGRCRDYLKVWDFDFDISPNASGQGITIGVQANLPCIGTA